MQQWLLVFDSTHHAIAAEYRLKEAALPAAAFQIIPTPRQITASCGLSLLFTGSIEPREMLRLLADHDVQWAGLYRKEEDGRTPWVRVEVEG
ncbi:MAG: DUF3343 domain-containing protein [Bacillota bacterium]|nr:DUF3343 domain-containing protein [Bacillota bacterium]MDW7676547.1 DUF3343 domain-containing protein [Bacillota bacterium]